MLWTTPILGAMESAHTTDVARRYATFAATETPRHSPVMQAWAAGVATDAEVVALIETLPPRQRQPNLVLAAARMVEPGLVDPHQRDARPDEYERVRRVLVERWDEVAAITATHHTQTNEAGRLAVVMPALSALDARHPGQEFALIEIGASAGLALHPHWWRWRYLDRAGHPIAEFGDPSGPELTTTVKNHTDHPDPTQVPPVLVPTELPPIRWRLGIDLNPLNPLHAETAQWLRTLVWPGQTDRLARLDHAVVAARHDPVLVLARDLTDPQMLDEILALVPRDLTPVLMHGAVLAYVPDDQRQAFGERVLDRVTAGELHWVSNEGAAVVPQVVQALAERPDFTARLRPGAFVVSIDSVPVYQADGHASWVL